MTQTIERLTVTSKKIRCTLYDAPYFRIDLIFFESSLPFIKTMPHTEINPSDTIFIFKITRITN